MQIVSIDQFIVGLCAIPRVDFDIGPVYEYVKHHSVDERSLQPYMFFSEDHYTRNLILKNDLFELVAICWETGQASPIHNHHNQKCWMAMPVGRLRVQNFRVLEQDKRAGYCRLEPSDAFDIHRLLPTSVDPAEPVHQVLNLSEFNERAVSLHIYSRPFDRCLVYSPAKNHFGEIQLHYTSAFGRLCEGEKL